MVGITIRTIAKLNKPGYADELPATAVEEEPLTEPVLVSHGCRRTIGDDA
jgi:hypothetical protein